MRGRWRIGSVVTGVVAATVALGGPATAATAQPAKAPQAVRHFSNQRFQRCLDADTNGGGNGGRVQLWDCGPWNQQWWR